MPSQAQIPTLASLEFTPYLNEEGSIQEAYQGKIGVYAIFDQQQVLRFVGYSRDVYLSLKQHLVRCPQDCFWCKVETITRPSRTLLEEIKNAWIAENGSLPLGNGEEITSWTKPLDVKPLLSEAEREEYQKLDELGQVKLLKKISRRFEGEVTRQLQQRGVKMEIRFNPKLKEQGLVDLK